LTVKIDFDVFERFRKLYGEDSEMADRLKEDLLEESIQNSLRSSCPPPEKDLRAIQWKIQVARATSKNPTGSMVKAMQMMWEKVGEEGGFSDAVNPRSQELEPKLRELEGREKQLKQYWEDLSALDGEEEENFERELPNNIVILRKK